MGRDEAGARPVLVLALSLAGLLVAIAATGLVGLAINQNVAEITDHALEHDINLEDEGDDMRAAVLDLRHYHRDLVFLGPHAPEVLLDFSTAYAALLTEIEEYAEIAAVPGVLSADELRGLVQQYQAIFGPAIALYAADRAAFDEASEQGLAILRQLAQATEDIDEVGEQQAEASLAHLERENRQARWILIGVLAGLVLVGAALVWIALRVGIQFRRLYEEQQASTRRLGEAIQSKADFIADASHELRTPLTVLRGNAEAGLAIDPQGVHRDIFQEIVAESVRMTKLVEDLLLLARSDADALPLHQEVVPAQSLAADLAERARVLLAQSGHELQVALAGQGTLSVDISRLEQAIMILIDNAGKYSEPGATVRFNTSSWNDEFIFEVTDTGPGIAEEDVSRIFDRFYRVDKARSRRAGGTGLGLSIAKTIVEAHGGRIDVHSHLQVGTSFRIHLPGRVGATRKRTLRAERSWVRTPSSPAGTE